MRDGIRVQTLVLAALLSGAGGFVVGVVITRDGSLLPWPPLIAGLLLVVMGGLVLWLARPVRRYLQGRATVPLDPIQAARTVVLAQAAALTGAAASGWFVGQLAVLVRDLTLVANQERVLPFVLMLAASVALAVAGMVAQHWCRVEPPDDAGEGEERAAAP
jgi:prepilin signal peptidase PulO-like enzyme (type II secretory pathway)